jgi:hypothetical protein
MERRREKTKGRNKAMDEYESFHTFLEDLEDLIDILATKEQDTDAPSLSLSEVERELGLDRAII